MKRRQEMLRGINTGDAVLLLGGDLNVTVVQAQVSYTVGLAAD
jgi:preprotein translocase subunit YajC